MNTHKEQPTITDKRACRRPLRKLTGKNNKKIARCDDDDDDDEVISERKRAKNNVIAVQQQRQRPRLVGEGDLVGYNRNKKAKFVEGGGNIRIMSPFPRRRRGG